MSFDIFASGTNSFHHQKKGCEDGSTLNMIKIISIVQSLDVSSLQNLGITATGGVIDYKTPGITDLMIKLAEKEMAHNISNAMCILAMNPNAGNGWVYVNATEKNTFWADKSISAKYNFSPGDSPGAEFLKRIEKCLTGTDLNNFGTLQQITVVLSKFIQKIDDSMTPMLNITLTN